MSTSRRKFLGMATAGAVGALGGVRGINDPRAVTLPRGKPVWYQPDNGSGYVLPFHFDARNTSALSLGTNHGWKGSQTT